MTFFHYYTAIDMPTGPWKDTLSKTLCEIRDNQSIWRLRRSLSPRGLDSLEENAQRAVSHGYSFGACTKDDC